MMLDPITYWPFEMVFFPFIKVPLSMWSPIVPIVQSAIWILLAMPGALLEDPHS